MNKSVKFDISALLGSSEPVFVDVVNVDERIFGKVLQDEFTSHQTLNRWSSPSDLPKGRGGFGIALDRNWKHGIPFAWNPDDDPKQITVGQLIDELTRHGKQATVTF